MVLLNNDQVLLLCMDMLKKLEGYDLHRAQKALEMLVLDRRNEFKELAAALRIPVTVDGWESSILKYCMDLNGCFKTWTSQEPEDCTSAQRCMTIIRQIANGKDKMIDVTNLQNVAYSLSEEFKTIYRRIE